MPDPAGGFVEEAVAVVFAEWLRRSQEGPDGFWPPEALDSADPAVYGAAAAAYFVELTDELARA